MTFDVGTPEQAEIATPEHAQSEAYRYLAIKLHDFYRTWEPELKISEAEHKLIQREEEAPLVENLINTVLLEVRGAMVRDVLSAGVYEWAINEMDAIQRSVETKEYLEQADVRRLVTFLGNFLFRLYPQKKSIEEILDELIHGEQISGTDTGGLNHVIESEREETVRSEARMLYDHRYRWDFYPEVTKGMPHHERSALRARLAADNFDSSLRPNENLDEIKEKIDRHEASADEIILYQISRNKIMGSWLGGILSRTEFFTPLGKEFEEFHGEMKKINRILFKLREMIEECAKNGDPESIHEINDLLLQAKIEIDKADLLMDRMFLALYPEIEDDQTGGINREKLEEILGINKK